jgi:tRNA pseudouridine38-40 synthase
VLAAAAAAPPRPHHLRPAATDAAASAAVPSSSTDDSQKQRHRPHWNPDPSSRPQIDEARLKAAAGPSFWPLPPSGPNAKKRAVALHVAYLGTPFRGSQLLREPDARATAEATVEGALEAAMLRCGLIAPSNFGDLGRVGWSRASRTDRGVHSLGTVVGLRALVDESEFDADPEGVGLAERINAALPPKFSGGAGGVEAEAGTAAAAGTDPAPHPPAIRVLSAQRVTKRFDCRRWAIGRAYEYYLPASALGIRLDGEDAAGGEADGAPRGPVALTPEQAEIVSRFKRALSSLEGHHPFHNYAGRRKQYASTTARAAAAAAVPSMRERVAARSARRAAQKEAASAAGEAEASSSASSSLDEDDDGAANATTTTTTTSTVSVSVSSSTSSVGEDDGNNSPAPAPRPRRREPFERRCWFLEEPDPSDPVSAAHYRTVTRFAVVPWGAADEEEGGEEGGGGDSNGDGDQRASTTGTTTTATENDVVRLVDGGVPCLRIRIEGASFMLNQIRNMVGSAAACARGLLPEPLLAASLSARVRAAMVKAPPHTLVLADTTFSPFATGYGSSSSSSSSSSAGGAPEGVARWSGERLELRARGKARQEEWRRAALGPAVQELLLHEDWRDWAEEELPRLTWPAADEVARRDSEWQVEERRRKAERRAAKAAAAEEAGATAAHHQGGLFGWLRGLFGAKGDGRT